MAGAKRHWRSAAALLAMAAMSGCASTSGWFSGWFGTKPSATASVLQGLGVEKPGPLKQFGRSVKGALDKTIETLTPAPVTQPDAASLSNTSKPSAEVHVSIARLHENSGNLTGAIEQYQKALALTPDHLGALIGLAVLHDRQGQLDQAAKYYAQAAEKHPDQPAVFNNLGLCLARQGKLSEAADALQKAVAQQPTKVLYRNNLASVFVESNHVDSAIALLTPLHGPATAHYNVGFLLQRSGRRDEALAHFHQAAALDPSLTAAQTWIAQLESHAAGALASGATSPASSIQASSLTPVMPLPQAQVATPAVRITDSQRTSATLTADQNLVPTAPSGPPSQVGFVQGPEAIGVSTAAPSTAPAGLDQPYGWNVGQPTSVPGTIPATATRPTTDGTRWQ